MSQRDLAAKTEVSQAHIWRIEHHRSDISLVVLERLADALNVRVVDLLREDDEDEAAA